MFNYLIAKMGFYGDRIKAGNSNEVTGKGKELYGKVKKNNIKVLTSFFKKKPYKRVSIFETKFLSFGSPVNRRAVLSEDLVTGNKTQINTDMYLNKVYKQEEFPNGRLQFSISKITIDKNGKQIDVTNNAYYKSPDGKEWIHYVPNNKPIIHNWNMWK